ncbi:GAF and ANTAR domain-containing protein [soil metagenome]
MSRAALLARTMVELADTLVDDFDVIDLLTVLTDRCVEVLDVSAAGLALASPGGELRGVATSSEARPIVELFDAQGHDGPGKECFQTATVVIDEDLATTTRWPVFAEMAIGLGFRSAGALPMRLRGDVLGALTLFRAETGMMPAADLSAAQALADVATIGILQHRAASEAQLVNAQLQQALNSRIVIEQAKGAVAARMGVDMSQPSNACANTPATATCGWPRWRRTWSKVACPPPPSADVLGRSRSGLWLTVQPET